MKKNKLIWNCESAFQVLMIISIFLLLSNPALALPNSINIQGKLTSSSGVIQTGAFNFTFGIYDGFTSGNKLYETNISSVPTDERGVYDVILQNINLPFDRQYYLGVKVNNDNEMLPRVNLTSVPYSFMSNQSKGLNATGDAVINNNVNITAVGNIFAAGNLSLAGQIRFGFGEFIDNLVGGFLRITGNLNVTSGAIIGGGLNVSGAIQAASLTDGNATITGGVVSANQVNVGGGFSNGGLTLQRDGTIVTQGDILFSGNVTVLNVTFLSVNGSIMPALDNIFDIGNGSFRWRNANFTGRIEAGALSVNGSTLYVDNANGRVGIGTASPAAKVNNHPS